jgi:hypothetical protein
MELAEVHFLAGESEDVLGCIETLERIQYKDARSRRALLAAMSLERLGRPDEARSRYEQALETAIGEEARCRYGLHLLKAGDAAAARRVFEEIASNAKHGGGAYRRENREWIEQAKARLAEMPR